MSSELPLRYQTPPQWAAAALRDPMALLNDHAHLEKKAAANALELVNRWPEPKPPENWVTAMTAIARDEVEHLAIVTRLLARRGGRLSRQHGNPYASALRALVRKGLGPAELVDRLMVSALIEARSCERFKLLADALADADSGGADDSTLGSTSGSMNERDPALHKLYRALWVSERGHYLTFLELAEQLLTPDEIERRWGEMLDAEARIIAQQAPGPRMHAGVERA